jgi:starch phosphorylase
LTIGTLDGANVEMLQEAGAENFFLFGLTEDEVARVYAEGHRPATHIEKDPELAEVLDLIDAGHFTGGDTEVLRPVVDSLRHHDPFLALADYRSYVDCQAAIDDAWQDADAWSRMSILNTARSGKFSSDRAIAQYCEQIWGVGPMRVQI